MIIRTILLFSLSALLLVPAEAQIFDKIKKKANELTGGGGLSQEEAGNGLKEALNIGIKEAVDFLSAENGYLESPYRILVPEEAQVVVSKLKAVPGFGNVEQQLIEKMNRAAELAANKATPIFVDAIKQLTFKDALNILAGEQDAATQYLRRTTTEQLTAEFMPIIQASLDEVNARTYWRSAVTAYNKIPLVRKTNPELDEHVTIMALNGMYSLIAEKEAGIRDNPALRTTELLQKVFGSQD